MQIEIRKKTFWICGLWAHEVSKIKQFVIVSLIHAGKFQCFLSFWVVEKISITICSKISFETINKREMFLSS